MVKFVPSLRRAENPDRSWRNAISPVNKIVGTPDNPFEIPAAVDTTPSIPLAPLLAQTLKCFNDEGRKASKSRIGMEFETNMQNISSAYAQF